MNPARGIALKLSSVAVFMAMSSLIKATADVAPPGEQMFFRSAFALPLIVVWLAARGDFPRGLKTANPMGHIWRGVIGSTAMAFSFFALGLLPLPEVVAIFFAAPILATIFAAMFLGEAIRVYRLAAVALGVVGVVIIVSPRLTTLDAGAASELEIVGVFAALIAAIFAALAQVFVRRLVATEDTAAIVFWFSATTTVLSLFSAPFGWSLPGGAALLMLILSGVAGGVGQILLTMSYRHAETAVIAPFDYAQIVFALIIGWFVFGEAPTPLMLAGAALTVSAGLIIIWRERRLGIERKQARGAMTPQG